MIHARPGWRLVALSALVLAPLGAVDGADSPPAGLTPAHNLAGSIDRAVFGSHMLTATGDPKDSGHDARGRQRPSWFDRGRLAPPFPGGLGSRRRARCRRMAALVLGLLWAPLLPLNKALWTGSFVLFTGGIAMLTLTTCYVLFDVEDFRRWAQPFAWLGFNPLAIYFLAELCGHLLDAPWPRGAVQPMTLRTWIFWDLLRPLVPGVQRRVALARVRAWHCGVLDCRGRRSLSPPHPDSRLNDCRSPARAVELASRRTVSLTSNYITSMLRGEVDAVCAAAQPCPLF